MWWVSWVGNRFPWKQKQSHLLRLGGGGKSVKSSWRKYISHKSIKKLINLQLEARMRVRSLELKISGLEIKFSRTGGCKPPFYFSILQWSFPGGSVVKCACQWRRHHLAPWSGKISGATTIEPVLKSAGTATTQARCHRYWSLIALEPVFCNRSHCNEEPEHRN